MYTTDMPRQSSLNRENDPTETIRPSSSQRSFNENHADNHFQLQDTFRILLATDNHLGYMEKDPIRGQDSFNSFEEILQLAQDREVDMVILGGDLFHDNKPSQKSLCTAMSLLRQYCLGDKPCPIEILSDQSENFPNRFATVNYQDPNYNVGIPVFSIHGNHDDPSGGGNLCALEVLSVSGLVNYFGKQATLDEIHIKPILLRKGSSYLALYGLGNVRDERLNRLFRDRKVKMYRPKESHDMNDDATEQYMDGASSLPSWFNMMVIHQNRTAHGRNNYIPEAYLADFLDLVLWGHEHQCLIDPVVNDSKNFYVTQPGSSVATSLCEGESATKHIGILSIQGTTFAVEKIRLKSVRPFVMDEVVLQKVSHLYTKDQAAVNEYLQQKVAEMIEIARINWQELNPDVDPEEFPKPLIRLKVEYTGGFTTFNPQRFGQFYIDKVANPKEIISFYRKRTAIKAKPSEFVTIEPNLPGELDKLTIQDLVAQYLDAQKLEILPENELADAVLNQVEKNDKDAIKMFVDKTLRETKNAIRNRIAPSKYSNAAERTSRNVVESNDIRPQESRNHMYEENDDESVDIENMDQLDREIAKIKLNLTQAFAVKEHNIGTAQRNDIRREVDATRAVRHVQDDSNDFYTMQETHVAPKKRSTAASRTTAAKSRANTTSYRTTVASSQFDDDNEIDFDFGRNADSIATKSTARGRSEMYAEATSRGVLKPRGKSTAIATRRSEPKTATHFKETLFESDSLNSLDSFDKVNAFNSRKTLGIASVSKIGYKSDIFKPTASVSMLDEVIPETQISQENDDDIQDEDAAPPLPTQAVESTQANTAPNTRGRKRELPSSLRSGSGKLALGPKKQTKLQFMSSQQLGMPQQSCDDSESHTLREFVNRDKRSRKR
ncbi:meiotic recombination, variant 2 [Batrachochytrium dendrobatidis]